MVGGDLEIDCDESVFSWRSLSFFLSIMVDMLCEPSRVPRQSIQTASFRSEISLPLIETHGNRLCDLPRAFFSCAFSCTFWQNGAH
jgi:hypothetical protein